ncbi:ChaN family lipoprotein [Xylophilus sp. ASV27]|uniref:ChaN family lipoprotein n=1 Tax=Xylophilus sp. ASV27 TaxID=2795129 RepID=UPI0018EAA26B|nr:ChaN family lipoprotein [Xylophilus sp. ASV27]
MASSFPVLAALRRCVPAVPALLLAGCAALGAPAPDVLLIGETHDAPGQPERVAAEVQALAARGRLAALALEMAPQGSTTVALGRDADDAAIRSALAWDARAWPWERYAPAIRLAVQAGVPVLGANLPAAQLRTAMADVSLDAQLAPAARQAQEDAIRQGHCGLLPERQIPAMTRVQIARDRSMAHVLAESVRAGRTVVLWAGSGHVDRALGVPQHLPSALAVQSVAMVAGGAAPAAADGARFDRIWATPAMAPVDHCAALRQRRAP